MASEIANTPNCEGKFEGEDKSLVKKIPKNYLELNKDNLESTLMANPDTPFVLVIHAAWCPACK